ncbi:MAG: imidazole glycerol phosphate synthase subunit HisH [Alphaproteobacteria bacterium]|nr:imidazole glycerol phosphate synthase subunit HisH [Alphaproteobacteria bacterium]
MSARIHIVDYGVGNLYSLANALREIGVEPLLSASPTEIANAERVILPGVGAFPATYGTFKSRGMEDAIRKYLETERPMLGICVGMQMLMTRSEEFGVTEGLGIMRGTVQKIADHGTDGKPHKIPHIGWTDVRPVDGGTAWKGTIFDGIAPDTSFYFVHSFTAKPEDESDRLADGFYNGQRITASVTRGAVTGTQFHPEKSGEAGLDVLRNFARL